MEKHCDFDDLEFEALFASRSLDASVFTHEAHLRLAWIHVSKYGIDAAIVNVTTKLKAFVASLGASDKYNETVTIAAVRAVYHFMLRSDAANFQNFISKNQRLKHNFKELLSHHYVTDIFKSPDARINYLEPELLPFD